MGLPKTKLLTEAEYLDLERTSEVRHLFVDGEVFAMAGESPVHGHVSASLAAIIVSQLRGKPCAAFVKEMRVRSGPIPGWQKNVRGMYSHPDVVVVCGESEFLELDPAVLLNPTSIFEVLSPSTELFDRRGKFHRFQTYNPTLTDYVLVAQDEPLVEHYHREPAGTWSYCRAVGLKAKLKIATIGVTLKLADVYDRVKFEE